MLASIMIIFSIPTHRKMLVSIHTHKINIPVHYNLKKQIAKKCGGV